MDDLKLYLFKLTDTVEDLMDDAGAEQRLPQMLLRDLRTKFTARMAQQVSDSLRLDALAPVHSIRPLERPNPGFKGRLGTSALHPARAVTMLARTRLLIRSQIARTGHDVSPHPYTHGLRFDRRDVLWRANKHAARSPPGVGCL